MQWSTDRWCRSWENRRSSTRRRPTTIPQFLDADLVDTLHVAVSPVKLGTGVRLRESPDELVDRFHLEVVPSPSGVSHDLCWRKDRVRP